MTLVQLRHFLALADARSFRRAADACHLTQPALSRSIRALEDELDQPLFDRVGWSVELTPSGRELLARARRLVDEADVLKETAQRLGQGLTGRLRIGLGSGPGALLTVPVLAHVARHHPGVRLEFARGGIGLLEQALRERRLDAMVIDARSLDPAPDLAVEGLGEMRGAFLVRPDHPLRRLGRPVRYDEVAAHPIASTPLSAEIARILVERYGARAHPDDGVRLRSDEIAPLVQVALQTDTVVLTIRRAAPELAELVLDPPLAANARFGLVTLVGRAQAPLLPMFRGLVAQHLRD